MFKLKGGTIPEQIKKIINKPKKTNVIFPKAEIVPVKDENNIPETVTIMVDKNGFASINLDKAPIKGILLSFTRTENMNKRQVGLKIKNEMFNFE